MFKTLSVPPYLILGLAIFSMFFGAGNVIYPMELGVHAGASTDAWLGFILTAIGAPLLGLYSVQLCNGNLFKLFENTKIKGATIWISILILALGPVGATPRCVILSHQALGAIFPGMSLTTYTLLLGAFLWIICLKRFAAFQLLGKYLSPTLLILLISIAVISFTSTSSSMEYRGSFFAGLNNGYQTMDLLASLLFAVTIWQIVNQFKLDRDKSRTTYLYASVIGAALLAIVYLCLGLAASKHATYLQPISKDMYLNTLALLTLGDVGSKLACLVIFLACLTTIVALVITCTDNALVILNKYPVKFRLSYGACISAMLLLTMIFANLGFELISSAISMIVTITYPVYIMIALCHILHCKLNFKWVNVFVYSALLGIVGYKVMPYASPILKSF